MVGFLRLLFFFLILLVSQQFVFSATYYVNDGSLTGDVYCSAIGASGNTGTSASSPKATFGQLWSAHGPFANGDIIYIDAGTYTAGSTSECAYSFSNSITIIGAGSGSTIIDNNHRGTSGAYNFATITNSVTIKNIQFKNFSPDTGGKVFHITSTGSSGVLLSDVVTNSNGGSAGYASIYIGSNCTVTINGNNMNVGSCNGAASYPAGGGIDVVGTGSTVNISNYAFVGNYKDIAAAVNGAALSITSANASTTVNVTNCIFTGNILDYDTPYGGGAIYCTSGNLNLTDCILTANQTYQLSTKYGGAAYFSGGTQTFTRVKVYNNTNSGGSTRGTIAVNGGALTITDSYFSGNTSDRGYDLYCGSGSISATNTTFGSTGTVLYQAGGTFTIANSGNPTKTGTFTVTNTTSPTSFTTPTTPSYGGDCTSGITIPCSNTLVYPTYTACLLGTLTPTSYSTVSGSGIFNSSSGLSINSSTGVINLAASSAGTYSVTYFDNGCSVSKTMTLVSGVTLSGTITGCVGSATSTFSADVTGGTWSSSDATIATINSSTGVIDGISAGVATMTYTPPASSNCSAVTRNITITATPSITATTPAARCGNGTVALGATASAGTINWYAASTGGVSLGTGTSFTTPSISSSTTYYVDATNSGCTSASRTAVVATRNAQPSLTGGQPSNGTICSGGTYSPSVTVTGGTSLTYQWKYATTSGGAYSNVVDGTPTNSVYSNATTNNLSVTGSISAGSSYYYKCYVTDAGTGCTASTISNSAQMTVTAAPTTSAAGPDITHCASSTFTMAGNTPITGSGAWSVVSGTATITTASSATTTVTGITAGTSATLRWTITNGTCTSTDDITLTNNNVPTITGPLNVCVASTIQLSGTGVPNVTSPWVTSNLTATTISNTGLVSGVSAGTTTITYLESNGCTNTLLVTVNLCTVCGANLTSVLGSDNQTLCLSSNLNNITYSTNVATGISNSGISGINGLPAGVSASWSSNTITISGTPTATGTFNYSIILTGGTCAGEVITGKIVVTPKIVPSFISVPSICSGDVLSALPTNSLNGYTGTWLPALDNTKTTKYTFTPNVGQCATTKSMNIVVNTPPSVSVNNPTICNGNSATLTATPVETGGKYKWSTGETTQSISVSPTSTQQYYVLYSLAPDLLCNIDFEDVQLAPVNSFKIVNQSAVPCWKTTASDGMIEVWGNGFLGVPAYSGTQFIELNANEVSTLYQDFKVSEGNSAKISFAHRGRNGVDVMTVEVGPVSGPFESLDTISTGNSNWSYHTKDYTFPTNGDSIYRIKFNSISSTGGSGVGNFLDAFSIVYSNCPSDTTFSLVTVSPKTKPTFDAISPVCFGSTITALPPISKNGISGIWTPALNNLATTKYVFTPNAGQCSDTTSLTIIVNSKPNITLGLISSPITCSGNEGSIELTGLQLNTSYTVNYSKNNTPISVNLSSNGVGKILISSLKAAEYTNISVVLSGCSSNSLLGPVKLVDPVLPDANASATTAICEGQTLSLSSDNPGVGATFTWTGPNGFTSNSQNPTVSTNAKQNMSGTYSVIQSYLGCTGVVSTVDVEVTTLPQAGIISGANPMCLGVTTTYTSSVSGGTWSSTNPAVASINSLTGVVTNNIPGSADITYKVLGTGGCADVSVKRSIVVNDNYTLNLTSASETDTQSVCLNTAISQIEYTIVGATGVIATNLPLGINANVIADKITISGTPSQKGTFNYIIKAIGGCGNDSVLGRIIVDDMLTPAVSITSSDADNIICLGTSVTFTAHPVNGGTSPTYQWKLNGIDVFGEVTNTYTKSTLVDGDQVSVVMTSNSACASPSTATSNIIITNIGNNVAPSFNTKSSICEDEIYSLPTTSKEGSVGTWSPSMNLKQTTKYTFTPDVAGCYTSTTYTLVVNPLPIVSTTIGSSNVCNNTATDIKLSSSTIGTTYTWTATNSLNVNGANSGSGSTIAQVLNVTDSLIGTAGYVITPKSGVCVGKPVTVNLTVNPSVIPSVKVYVDSLYADTITICPDNSLTLHAIPTNGGTNPIYQWKVNNVNKGTNSPFFSFSQFKNNDLVSVTMTSNQPCANPITISSNKWRVLVRSNPLKVIGEPMTACTDSSGSITVKGNGVGQLSWSVFGNTNLLDSVPHVVISTIPDQPYIIDNLTDKTYMVYFNDGTCVYQYKATVTKPSYPEPPVNILFSKPAPICKGDSVLLTAMRTEYNLSNYVWVKDDVDTLSFKDSSIWVNSSGKFSVNIVTNGCESSFTDTVVTFIDQPTPMSITEVIQPSCTVNFGSVKLSGLPLGNWKISSTPSVGAPINGTGNSYTLSNLNPSTTYAITVQNNNGCFSDTTQVKIKAKILPPSAPKVTITSQPTCSVDTGSVLLTFLPKGSWTVISSPIVKTYTGKTSSKFITDLVDNTTYTFVVKDSNGCTSVPSLPVVINKYYGKPSKPTVNTPQTFCSIVKPIVANLDAGTSISPIWYKDLSSQNVFDSSALLVQNGKYYLTQKVNGCESDRVLVTVKLNVGPKLPTLAPISYCATSLHTISDLTKKISVTNNSIAIYDGILSGNALPSSDILQSKDYYYEADSLGCVSESRQKVKVTIIDGTLPKLTTTTPAICTSNNLTYGDLSKEVGSALGLIWYATSNGGSSYALTDKVSFPPMKQTYYVAYKPNQVNACESKDRIQVTVTFVLSPTNVTMKDNFYQPCKDAKETVANLPTAPYNVNTIAWFTDPNSTNPLKLTDPLYSTNYYAAAYNVDATTGKKCFSSKKDLVNVHLYDVAFIAHPENSICEKNTGTLTIDQKNIQGIAPFTFTIKDKNGEVVGNTAKTTNLKAGEYTILVVDSKNCKQTVNENVGCTYVDLPHILTPDGDGKNDTWIIHYYEKYPSVQVTIFNRWGSKVYTSAIPYMDTWDGKASSDITTLGEGYLPAGTYFYIIDKGNGEAVESGYIELVK